MPMVTTPALSGTHAADAVRMPYSPVAPEKYALKSLLTAYVPVADEVPVTTRVKSTTPTIFLNTAGVGENAALSVMPLTPVVSLSNKSRKVPFVAFNVSTTSVPPETAPFFQSVVKRLALAVALLTTSAAVYAVEFPGLVRLTVYVPMNGLGACCA